MELGFQVESAQSKREQANQEDVPVRVPMAPRSGQRRNPSTDQKKVRRQMSKKSGSVLTERFSTVASIRAEAANYSTTVDAAWSLVGKLNREWGNSGYSLKIAGRGGGTGIAHCRHSDGSEFMLTSDRYGNVQGPMEVEEIIEGPFASVDAVMAVLGKLSREWGEFGYAVSVTGDGGLGAVAVVRHSDGSEFTITADRYGVAKSAARTAAMGEEDDEITADGEGYAECPACYGVGNLMGQLGNRAWYRCRDCGTTFDGGNKTASRKTAADEEYEEDEPTCRSCDGAGEDRYGTICQFCRGLGVSSGGEDYYAVDWEPFCDECGDDHCPACEYGTVKNHKTGSIALSQTSSVVRPLTKSAVLAVDVKPGDMVRQDLLEPPRQVASVGVSRKGLGGFLYYRIQFVDGSQIEVSEIEHLYVAGSGVNGVVCDECQGSGEDHWYDEACGACQGRGVTSAVRRTHAAMGDIPYSIGYRDSSVDVYDNGNGEFLVMFVRADPSGGVIEEKILKVNRSVDAAIRSADKAYQQLIGDAATAPRRVASNNQPLRYRSNS